MDNSNTICPVCTLYLREGVTLQAHLDTHPKDQVIEALLKVSNGGAAAQESQSPPTSGSSFAPVQTFANSNASFISQATPYVNPQTQMTTAVTYQHFMTSNGSAIMPQYIQVPTIINPTTNIPVISNQAVDFVPNQTMNYSQTMYNPLYNPYIPHPYPFTQPLYTSYPVSALPAVESNTQTNRTPSSSAKSSQVGSLPKASVVVTKCSVATSTEMDKRSSKNIGAKKSIIKLITNSKKLKSLKQKSSESGSRSLIKVGAKNPFGVVGSTSRFGFSKKTVIRTLRPKSSQETSSSTNSRMISPPPLTPRAGATKYSLSGSKTPPPPPLAKAPCFEALSFIKSEDVTDGGGPGPASAIINESSSNEGTGFAEPDHKPSSVIVDSSTLVQSRNNEIRDCKEGDDEFQVESMLSYNSEGGKEDESETSKDPTSGEVEESNEGEEYKEEEGESERQEKVFEMVEVEEESKIDVYGESKEVSEERNGRNGDVFGKQENYREESRKEKSSSDASYPEFVEPGSKNVENEHRATDFSFYNKEINDSSSGMDAIRGEGIPKATEIQPMTYTDLQPAKSSRLFQDLGLTTASLNFNNFMEVEGIKIIFNNAASAVPFDPLMKLTTGIQTDGRNITAFMKRENQVSSHAIVDSVIQLMSGSESKSDLAFGDNFTPTTSQVNDIQLDLPDLSPLALNIQADESMPARGELSEQESLGAENSTWNLFHGSNATNTKSIEEWRNDSAQFVSVIGSKKGSKTFKCSTCSEVFSCPKERRVHKNTVHMNKSNKSDKGCFSKKPKSYLCSFCNEVFTSLRDRKAHVVRNHQTDAKIKKPGGQIKEENAEPECINIDETDAPVKNEAGNNNLKTESSLPSAEADAHRVKYCARCSLPFVGVKKLREHLRVVHGEIRFKCETCSACFDEETEYNDHLLVHPLLCDKCGKAFHKKPNLNLHMKRHLDVKPYECTLCPKSFITRQKLEEHTNGHSGKKPLKCTLCDKTFSRHSNLIQHRNLHHLNVKKKIKDFVCRCGEVFHSLRKLEWHKEIHEPKPKPCSFCSQKFIHSASVTRHIRRAHLPDYLPGDNREFDNVQCPICEKVYLRSSLVVHMRVHNGEKPFACKICNKRFSTKWNLELHSWTHQSRSSMPFKCQICKSAFFRETDFVAHVNSHRNYKPFTCNVCGQKFIRKYSCLRHQEEHKKSKQFVCAVNGCAKSFHRGYYLRDHMKVHTGVRPHTCHICGKASSTKSNHNKHVRIHDTREPVNTEN